MSERAAKRVLVIDDDGLSRDVLELLLANEGYDVTLASSGEEALAGLDCDLACPDLVLTDMQMPGLCGEELLGRLQTMCSGQLRVIAMSGSVPGDGTPAGADGFLLKPFSMEEFAGMVRTFQLGGATPEEGRPLRRVAGDQTAAAAVLDTAVFLAFRGMLGADALRELYSTCVEDVLAQWRKMQEASQAGDQETLRKSAHAVKGSLGMVGARELEQMCLNLEMGSVNSSSVTTLERFPSAIERLRDMLNALGVTGFGNPQE